MSDQRFTRVTSTGQVKTIAGGSTNIGPCRITYIQGKGHASGQLEYVYGLFRIKMTYDTMNIYSYVRIKPTVRLAFKAKEFVKNLRS